MGSSHALVLPLKRHQGLMHGGRNERVLDSHYEQLTPALAPFFFPAACPKTPFLRIDRAPSSESGGGSSSGMHSEKDYFEQGCFATSSACE
ncbi:hypothetical protein CEXT_556301 [Caerostris extrusa]|uniref:Uncharacterized protein n=1 Tax=Caerostris extrusa TaxID=172846 RepID=A0AAV4X0C9_CAEEX|nr:hypothetical protein CEXT_556301 [Caerostris extrusa]